MTWKAVVIGGTGATGQHLLAELCGDPSVSAVVSIARRKIDVNDPSGGRCPQAHHVCCLLHSLTCPPQENLSKW